MAAQPVTIVTGGSRGIGASVAAHLARAGHHVAVNYRQNGTAAERVAAQVVALGGRAITVQADVCAERDVDRLFQTTTDELGPVTGLVNNAGATLHSADLADTPVPVLRQVLEVNLLSAILCARRAVLAMSTRRGGSGGSIVSLSSAAATLGSPHEYVHYAATKAGIDTFTIGLAKEVAREGIRVNAVAPGLIRTDIHDGAGDPGRLDRMAPEIPIGRAGEPDEVAPAITWLMSAEASYVTGTVLRVAGGR